MPGAYMSAGYSLNPLFKKLGLKEGTKIAVISAPYDYSKLVGDMAESLDFAKEPFLDLDFIHLFTNSVAELEEVLPKLKTQIRKDGMIWVSWYKKSAKKATELNENMIRDFALSIGLVDVKVCAIDDDWSGLKLVFRLRDR